MSKPILAVKYVSDILSKLIIIIIIIIIKELNDWLKWGQVMQSNYTN